MGWYLGLVSFLCMCFLVKLYSLPPIFLLGISHVNFFQIMGTVIFFNFGEVKILAGAEVKGNALPISRINLCQILPRGLWSFIMEKALMLFHNGFSLLLCLLVA